jgi:uncharacterized protein YggU (UPF0235/DUF167 family)
MIIEVRVKPNSKIGPQVQLGLDGSLLVYVREPAVDGKANQAVVRVLAEYYKVSKSRVKFISGLTRKQKRFVIDL